MHCACMTYCAGMTGADQLNIHTLMQAHVPEIKNINRQALTVGHCWKGAKQSLVQFACFLHCIACNISLQTTTLDLPIHMAATQAAV